MKLPNDIKQAITQELIDELHEDTYNYEQDEENVFVFSCLECDSRNISPHETFCSKICLELDLKQRWMQSDLYKQEQEEKK